jgi:hypothetical protein
MERDIVERRFGLGLVLALELELKEKDLTRININKRRGNITPRSGGNEKNLNLLKQRA